MMPTVGARVDSSQDDIGENHEGKGGPTPDESDSDIDQAPANGLDADDVENAYMSLEGMPVFNECHGPLIHDAESFPFQIFTDLFPDEIMDLLVSETNRYFTWKMDQLGGWDNLPPSARARQWVDLTLPELKAFLATIILI